MFVPPFSNGSDASFWRRHVRAAQRLCRVRVFRRHKTRLRNIAGQVVFVLGLMLAPPLAACDLTVWLSCRDLNTHDCVELLSLLSLSSETAEAGLTNEVAPIAVSGVGQPLSRAAHR
jgi:hypothetical protein